MPWIGPVVGGLVGGGLGLIGASQSANAQRDAANTAANAGAFRPYNVYSGYGSGTFSGNNATSTLSPEYQKLRDQYLQQAGGFNAALTNYDPQSAAQSLYGKLHAISAPQEQQMRNEFENRLISQGQYGLQQGGENPLLRSYTSAEMGRGLQRELSAFGLAQDVQDRLQNRSLAATSGAAGIDALPLQQLSLGGVFGGRGAQASQFGAALQNQAAVRGSDASAQLWANLGQQIGPAAGQAIGNYFGRSQYTPPTQAAANAFYGNLYTGQSAPQQSGYLMG